MVVQRPDARPYGPPAWDGEDVYGRKNAPKMRSIQACWDGVASPEQQRLAMESICEHICRVDDLSYRPESDRDTVFAEGMRFVGLQLRKCRILNFTKLIGAGNGGSTDERRAG